MKSTILLLFLIIISFGSCNHQDRFSEGKIAITATTGMIGDAASFIGGDLVEVVTLMGPGVDPHLYKATQGDLNLLTQADIVLYNGLHLEGKMGEVFEKLAKVKPVIAVTASIPKNSLHQSAQYQGSFDPHVWFDLSLWKHAIELITKELSVRYPEHKETFKTNGEKYNKKLLELHHWAVEEISKIPEDSRLLITAHDAFGYFGAAYSIEVKGIQGISTLSEFGLRDRVELVQLITNRKVKSIFMETSVPPRAINSIIEGCKEKGFEVTVGGYLFSDAMGEKNTPEGTFFGTFESNVNTITSALK